MHFIPWFIKIWLSLFTSLIIKEMLINVHSLQKTNAR